MTLSKIFALHCVISKCFYFWSNWNYIHILLNCALCLLHINGLIHINLPTIWYLASNDDYEDVHLFKLHIIKSFKCIKPHSCLCGFVFFFALCSIVVVLVISMKLLLVTATCSHRLLLNALDLLLAVAMPHVFCLAAFVSKDLHTFATHNCFMQQKIDYNIFGLGWVVYFQIITG